MQGHCLRRRPCIKQHMGHFFTLPQLREKSSRSILFTIVSPMYILSIFELYQWIAESLSFLALYDITYVVSQKKLLNN